MYLGQIKYITFELIAFLLLYFVQKTANFQTQQAQWTRNAYAIAWVVFVCCVGMAVPLNSTTCLRLLRFK